MPLIPGVGEAGGIINTQFERTFIPHNFTVVAKSEGGAIKLTWSVPEPLDYPDWGYRIRILRKTHEWPQRVDDPDAQLVTDQQYLPGSGSQDLELTQTGLVPGKIYYYALYELGADQEWVMDDHHNRRSAYPYSRWGCGEYLFSSLPRGWKTDDAGVDDLYDLLTIFGALCDDIKTDCEHLLSLFNIDEVHEELLWMLEFKVYWPGWKTVGGIARKKELKNAVDLAKVRGREDAFVSLLEQTCAWVAEIVEGWKYVMFSNGLYGSKTPDLSTPASRDEIQDNMGLQTDVLHYTNANYGRNSVGGLGIYLQEILSVSMEYSPDLLSRWKQLISWSKGCWVTYDLVTFDTNGAATLRHVSQLGE